MGSFLIYLLMSCITLGCSGSAPEPKEVGIKTVTVRELVFRHPNLPHPQNELVSVTGYLVLRAEVSFRESTGEHSWTWRSVRVYDFFEDPELKGNSVKVYRSLQGFHGFPAQRDFFPIKLTVIGKWQWINEIGSLKIPAHCGLLATKCEKAE